MKLSGFGVLSIATAFALSVPMTRARADTKSQFYEANQSASVTAGGYVLVQAECLNTNDIIVGGGCWGSDTMRTFDAYPGLSDLSGFGYFYCGIWDSSANTVWATALCKTPGTDSKSNYYTRTGSTSAGPSSPAGNYNATAYCDNTSDPVVTGGVTVTYGYDSIPNPGFMGITGQVAVPSGSSKDHWYAIEYYYGPGSNDTMTTTAICKSGGSKSNYETPAVSTTWSSGPANPTKLEVYCSDPSYKILNGGCWGTGVYFTNATVPVLRTTTADSFRCNVLPLPSGQAGVTGLCQKN